MGANNAIDTTRKHYTLTGSILTAVSTFYYSIGIISSLAVIVSFMRLLNKTNCDGKGKAPAIIYDLYWESFLLYIFIM